MGEYRNSITRLALAPDHATSVTRNDPACGAEEMVKDLKEKVFPDKPVHFIAVNTNLPRTPPCNSGNRSGVGKRARVL